MGCGWICLPREENLSLVTRNFGIAVLFGFRSFTLLYLNVPRSKFHSRYHYTLLQPLKLSQGSHILTRLYNIGKELAKITLTIISHLICLWSCVPTVDIVCPLPYIVVHKINKFSSNLWIVLLVFQKKLKLQIQVRMFFFPTYSSNANKFAYRVLLLIRRARRTKYCRVLQHCFDVRLLVSGLLRKYFMFMPSTYHLLMHAMQLNCWIGYLYCIYEPTYILLTLFVP